jgi:hypothetical protein
MKSLMFIATSHYRNKPAGRRRRLGAMSPRRQIGLIRLIELKTLRGGQPSGRRGGMPECVNAKEHDGVLAERFLRSVRVPDLADKVNIYFGRRLSDP